MFNIAKKTSLFLSIIALSFCKRPLVFYSKIHLVTKPEKNPPILPCHFAQKAVYLYTVRKQNSFPFQNLNIKENLT
jgi:hypothetical protein